MLKLRITFEDILFLFMFNGVFISVFEARSCGVASAEVSEKEHTHAIIFFHGAGDEPKLWNMLFSGLKLLHTHIVTPTAEKIPLSVLRGRSGKAWYDFKGVEKLNEEDEEGLEKAIAYVHSLINDEIKKGIPSENIIVGGFSQGGALALLAGLKYPGKLAAIITFSAWLPIMDKFNKSWVTHNRDIPIFIYHNKSVLPIRYSTIAIEKLRTISKLVAFKKLYSGILDERLYLGKLHKAEREDLREIFELIKSNFFIQRILGQKVQY